MDVKRPDSSGTSRAERGKETSSPLMEWEPLPEWDKTLQEWNETLPEWDSHLQEWKDVPDKWEPLPEWKELAPVECGNFKSKRTDV